MPAKQESLREKWELMAADPECRPDAVLRKLRDEIEQRFRIGDRAIADAKHDLDQQGISKRAIGQQRLRELQIAAVEQFELGQYACRVDALRHFGDVARCVDHDRGARDHRVEIQPA